MSDITTNATLRDYIRVLFRQKAVIITTFITVMVTVTLVLMLKTPTYEASVKILVSSQKQVESPYYQLMDAQNDEAIATQADIVKSDPVLDRTVRALGLYNMPLDYENRFCSPLKAFLVNLNTKIVKTKLERLSPKDQTGFRYRMAIEWLRGNITIKPIPDTSLFYINVKDFSGYGAAILANVLSRSYVIFDLEQQVADIQTKYGDKNLAVTQFKDSIAKMEKDLNGQPVSNIEAIGPASVKIIEQAQIPIRPHGLPQMAILILALFMGVFLGVMLAFMFEYMNPTFKSQQEADEELGLTFLGSVPRIRRADQTLLNLKNKKGPFSHFYQVLADEVYLLAKGKRLKTILLTASGKEENAENVMINLGAILSQKGSHNVLLIDANLRNSSLTKTMKIDNTLGFSHVIEGACLLKEAIKEVAPGLHIVPPGATQINPVILFDSPKVKETLDEATKKYEIVLVNCPNLKLFKDGIVLAGLTDAAIVVISENKTRRQVLKVALQPFFDRKVNILGFIMNNRLFPIPRFVYERI